MDKNVGPLVTVLMAVFNGDRFLGEAIQSILGQHYQNFELLIYNDGSTDRTMEIINSFSDKRIVSYHHQKNIGYVSHLNHGLSVAKGKYIARMDADDVSFPDRLKAQVEFLERFSDIGICGTYVGLIDEHGSSLGYGQHYTDDAMLRIKLLSDSCFAHPSVMMKKSVLDANCFRYDENYTPAEDYRLWCDLSLKTKLANLPDILLNYRIHAAQITKRKNDIQRGASDAIRKIMLQDFLERQIEERDFALHNTLFTQDFTISRSYVIDTRNWLAYLIKQNRIKKRFNEESLEKYIAEIWFSLCTHSCNLGLWIIFICFNSQFRLKSIPKLSLIKFAAKSIIRYSSLKK